MSITVKTINNKYLHFVSDLSKYKVHHEDIDPRGFDLLLDSGERIGKVEGLLADTSAQQVRYLEIAVEDELINLNNTELYSHEDRHLLVPIGIIRLEPSQSNAVISGLVYQDLVGYPRFNRTGGYSTRYEIDTNDYLSSRHVYGKDYRRTIYSNDDFRNREHLDADFYNTRLYR